jgi:hypothetical protein
MLTRIGLLAVMILTLNTSLIAAALNLAHVADRFSDGAVTLLTTDSANSYQWHLIDLTEGHSIVRPLVPRGLSADEVFDYQLAPNGYFVGYSIHSERSPINSIEVYDLRSGRRIFSEKQIGSGRSGILWSPDGRYLTLSRTLPGGSHHAYLVDVITQRRYFLPEGSSVWRWSHNAQKILLIDCITSCDQAYLYDLATRTAEPLASPPVDMTSYRHSFFVWSPDDRWIAFHNGGSSLILYNVPGKFWQPIWSPLPDQDYWFMWSPQSDQLLVSMRDNDLTQSDVLLVDVPSGRTHAFPVGDDVLPNVLAWSSDSEHVVYTDIVSVQDTVGSLFYTTLTSNAVTLLSHVADDNFQPLWSPTGNWLLYNAAGSAHLRSVEGKAIDLAQDGWYMYTFWLEDDRLASLHGAELTIISPDDNTIQVIAVPEGIVQPPVYWQSP